MKKYKDISTERKIYFIVFSLLTFFTLWFIFSHSAKNATDSSADSEGLSLWTARLINGIFGTALTSKDTVGFIRTLAHFAEYTALCFCFTSSLGSIWEKTFGVFKFSLPFCFLVSLADEILQTFFEGRAFQLSDIFIDFTGALTGILIFTLSFKIYSSLRKRIKN